MLRTGPGVEGSSQTRLVGQRRYSRGDPAELGTADVRVDRLDIQGQADHTGVAAFNIDDCRYTVDRSEALPLRQAARDIVGDSRVAVVAKRLDLLQGRPNGGRGTQHAAAGHERRKQSAADRSHVSIDQR